MTIELLDIEIESADLSQEIPQENFFNYLNRVKYNQRWRAKHANKHRPSYERGQGKVARREIRRPSFDDKKFRQFQGNRAPPIHENDQDVMPEQIERQPLYSLDHIQLGRDWDFSLISGKEGEILYISYSIC